MLVFIDFEASSLSRLSYPIEVGWIFEDGAEESHLIRPAPGWNDWDERSAAIHGLDRALLQRDGAPHDQVARRMLDALSGHVICASAPSWDGKWLSRLLRDSGFPRHSLRLRGTDEILVETASTILAGSMADPEARLIARSLADAARSRSQAAPPRHRALADAVEERRQWMAVRSAAEAVRSQTDRKTQGLFTQNGQR